MDAASHPLRRKLAQGRTLAGIWCGIPQPQVVGALAVAGLDFVFLDCEHGSWDFASLEGAILACEDGGRARSCARRVPTLSSCSGCSTSAPTASWSRRFPTPSPPSARWRWRTTHPTARAATTRSRAAGTTACRRSRSSPAAIRSPACWSNRRTPPYTSSASPRCRDRPASTSGVLDYSVALGIPGQVDDPRVQAFVERAARIGRAAGKAVGTTATDAAQVERLTRVGVDVLLYGTDAWLIGTAAKAGLALYAGAPGRGA